MNGSYVKIDVEKFLPFVHDGQITWTMTTGKYCKYTLNLITWLKTVAKVPWTLCVLCCDKESPAFFRREGIPFLIWNTPFIKQQDVMAAFGTKPFEDCNRVKLEILEWFALHFAELKITNSLYLDGDIVVQRDPWIVLKGILDSSDNEKIFFQCDCDTMNEHLDEGDVCKCPCSGVIATRHVSRDQAAIYAWNSEDWIFNSKQDQPYIYFKLLETKTPYKILSRREFGNGMWRKSGVWKDGNWSLLHYNFLVSGTKRVAMKKEGHWLINL